SFLLLAGFMTSCNTARNPLFGKRSAHAQYAESLEKSGLDKSVLGTTWLQAAEDALRNPQNISLPYKETGFFGADKPSAAGFVFTAARGESVVATLISNPDSVRIFFELW